MQQQTSEMQQPSRSLSNNKKLGYSKEFKRQYLEDVHPRGSRTYSILDSNDMCTFNIEQLSNMSCCILSYNGPSSLTPEDKLLNIDPTKLTQIHSTEYIDRANKRVSEMFSYDSKMNGALMLDNKHKDSYLLEVKQYGYMPQNYDK